MMTVTVCSSVKQLRESSLGQLPDEQSGDLFVHVHYCDACAAELMTRRLANCVGLGAIIARFESAIGNGSGILGIVAARREPNAIYLDTKRVAFLAAGREPSGINYWPSTRFFDTKNRTACAVPLRK